MIRVYYMTQWYEKDSPEVRQALHIDDSEDRRTAASKARKHFNELVKEPSIKRVKLVRCTVTDRWPEE